MNATVFDWDRQARTNVPEAVFCASKTVAHIADIIQQADSRRHSLLLTKLSGAQHEQLLASGVSQLDYDPQSETAIVDHGIPDPVDPGVAIVSAGTSDIGVVYEAKRTLSFVGIEPLVVVDVGVAGLWRLTERQHELRKRRVIIAVAGMEGALFSVLAGLVKSIVIAVPTSVGYGVAESGRTALHAALTSCSPGIVTVNIDNGFGAACAAIKLLLSVAADTEVSIIQ